MATPAVSQDSGARVMEFAVQNRLEGIRNPGLTPGGDDSRVLLNTNLHFGLTTATRRAQIGLVASGDVRQIWDSRAGVDEGLMFGGQTVQLTYATQAPRAAVSAAIGYARNDLALLSTTDLVTAGPEGGIRIAEDFGDATGTGQRETLTYRVAAEGDAGRPFGWGAAVSGRALRYSDVAGAALEDNASLNAAITARFDIEPGLRINTHLGYAQRDSDGRVATTTTSLTAGITSVRSDSLTVQAQADYANPDATADRVSVAAGLSYAPTRLSALDLTAGAVFSDEFRTRMIGQLGYRLKPTTTSAFDFRLSSDVTDSIDNAVVLNTAAILGADITLTPLWSLSFDAVYARQRRLATGIEDTEVSASLQVNRQLTRDWQLSAGARRTVRQNTGSRDASKGAVFVTLGRSWKGGF